MLKTEGKANLGLEQELWCLKIGVVRCHVCVGVLGVV